MTTQLTSHQSQSASELLIPELEEYRRQFEAIKQDAQDLIAGLTEAQFNWRPEPGRWSIAECLEHLNVTARLYLPRLRAALEQARARQWFGQGPFRYGFIGTWFVKFTEPPPKTKVKAPKRFQPPPDQPLRQVTADFLAFQEEFLAFVRAANGVDLGRAKVPSPGLRWLRFGLGQGIALMTAHERRHLWQARQVKNDSRFPPANGLPSRE
jgi:hypothetical protein